MRENDDNIRLYAPLLRRIIILVAVITAVPVVLWTITAVMRTYVAPPKVPTFRPIVEATATVAPGSTAADPSTSAAATPAAAPVPASASPTAPVNQAANGSQPSPATAFASAAGPDSTPSSIPSRGPVLNDRIDSVSTYASAANATVAKLTPAVEPSVPQSAAGSAAPAAADSATLQASPVGAVATTDIRPVAGIVAAAQAQPDAIDRAADVLPPADPITGPVPLPHPRPPLYAMVDTGIPMPRPRPAIAPEATPGTTDTSPASYDPAMTHY
jgi:hypothetical protein